MPSEGEIVEAIEFSDLVLVHFHTPNLSIRAKGTKVVGLPTCVAQLLPIWARAFSLNSRLKALDVTDLGSKGAYGIGGLSREKYAKFSQKYCS